MSIYSKLSALLTAANTKTGESDVTLTDAVQTLIDGYGQGGGCIDVDAICDRSITGSVTVGFTNYYNERTFMGCTGITEFHAPNWVGGTGSNLLAGCTGLTVFDAPNYAEVRSNLSGCTSLQYIVLKGMTSAASGGVFRPLAALKGVDFALVNNPGNIFDAGYMFENDSNLETIIIRKANGVAALSNINNFNGTRYASGGAGGTLYVPSALVETYKAATNWSTILGYTNNQIKAIEGSTYETHYVDGTVIS